MKVIWSFFCRKNRSRALPVQVEENTFEDCPSFSRIFCFKYKFIYLPRCMMKNKEETPIKPIIREKMLKLQYPRSWNLSKYKYFLKIRVAVFFVESWISRSVLYRVIVLTGSKLVLYQNDKTPKSQPEAFLDEGFLWNSSSGWLLGIFWFRYWTGGGNHPVPFCGSSVTESNFQAVLFFGCAIWIFVPLAKIHHCSDADRLLSVKRWQDCLVTLGNYAKNSSIMEVHQQCLYLSTPALIDLMNCPKFPFLCSLCFLFLKAECLNLKIPLFFYLESFVRSNKSHNILAHCLPDVFKYLQNIWSSFFGLQIQYLDPNNPNIFFNSCGLLGSNNAQHLFSP